MDIKDWKRRLSNLLKEHPDIDAKTTGQVELNLNCGSVTKMYKIESESKDEGTVTIKTRTELK